MPGRKATHSPADTVTVTPVSDTASSTTLAPANAVRLALSILNTSSAALFVRVGGGTASAAACSRRLAQWEYFELPAGYTGAVTGVWATDPNDGAALVTEYT
jgi:hypothetical protein